MVLLPTRHGEGGTSRVGKLRRRRSAGNALLLRSPYPPVVAGPPNHAMQRTGEIADLLMVQDESPAADG
jgi:hypothetical protein